MKNLQLSLTNGRKLTFVMSEEEAQKTIDAVLNIEAEFMNIEGILVRPEMIVTMEIT